MKKIKKKNRILLMFGLLIIQFISYSINVLAVQSNIASDNTNDLYKFEIDYVESISEDLIDGKSIEIEEMNDVYTKLDEKKDTKAEKVDNPKDIDVKACYFDTENHTFIIKMCSKTIEFDKNDLVIGFIWSSEQIFMFFLYNDDGYYVDLDDNDNHSIDFDDYTLEFDKDFSEDFNDEEYVKMIIVYFEDDSDKCIIEFYDSRYNYDILLFIFWLIIGLIIFAIIIILLLYYKNKGVV